MLGFITIQTIRGRIVLDGSTITLAYVGLVMEFICWLRKHYHNLKNCTLYLQVIISESN